MKGFVSGILLCSILTAIAIAGKWLYLKSPCDRYCGHGTTCENEICVAATSEEADGANQAKKKKSKKKHRRGRKHEQDSDPQDGQMTAREIPWDKDNDVPDFNPNANRTIAMNQGSDRLDAHAVNRALRSLDPAFQSCVADASARSGGQLKPGKVRIQFGVSGSGSATGVRVQAPAHLKKFGIVPCVRRSVFDHRYPTFDGPESRIETSFDVQ